MTHPGVPTELEVELLSDATFGGERALAAEVDLEVDFDELGLPIVSARRLRSRLRDCWLSMAEHFQELDGAASVLFGRTKALDSDSVLHFGRATVEPAVREIVRDAVRRTHAPLDARDILQSLTAVRWQTAEDRTTGAPQAHTLRTTRVVLRKLILAAPLTWHRLPTTDELTCLALCTLATREMGSGRNRGRGAIRLTLRGGEFTGKCDHPRRLVRQLSCAEVQNG